MLNHFFEIVFLPKKLILTGLKIFVKSKFLV